jgi:hypothetical protein
MQSLLFLLVSIHSIPHASSPSRQSIAEAPDEARTNKYGFISRAQGYRWHVDARPGDHIEVP